jgi:hypothetical protein
MSVIATSLFTNNGSGGGRSFSVAYDSTNYNIVIANTSGATASINASVIGTVIF